jgi:hypothetical protein
MVMNIYDGQPGGKVSCSRKKERIRAGPSFPPWDAPGPMLSDVIFEEVKVE